MNTELSQKDIGQRITEFRKLKGLSQVELAKRLKISRPSLTQIELGNRSVDARELQRLSMILGFSLDEFMSKDLMVSDTADLKHYTRSQTAGERISKPRLRVNKLKNVLLFILEKCAGKPNVGETVLYKLLYFSDFNYYEQYEEHLTGATYRKLPYGPVPEKIDSVINQMIEDGQLQRNRTNYYGLQQTRYLPLTKANLTGLKASEIEVVNRVIDQMSEWSAAALSDYSHKDMPWLASKEGKELDYELVFYRDTPFSTRNYGEEVEEK